MRIGELLKNARSRASHYLEVLDAASDYDPVEEQRRWIALLEARVARIEAVRSSRQASATTWAPET